MYYPPNQSNYQPTNQDEATLKAAIIGAAGIAVYYLTRLLASGPSKKQWKLLSSTIDTVSHPVDIGVKLKIYEGINESEGKYNIDWRRKDGKRGTVYADTEKAAVKKALKEAGQA